MKIEQLRKLADREEVDYTFLMSALSAYSKPRNKITSWLRSGELIRIKKGLYIFGKEVSLIPYSYEVLANLIYGPSAISLSYALSTYGIIPERVSTITSITNKKNKVFSTPIGEFNYEYINTKKYAVGIELATLSNNRHYLIASPEKALCDHIHITDKNLIISTEDAMANYLLNDLRIDEGALKNFRVNKLTELCAVYSDERLLLLKKLIHSWKHDHA